MVYDIIQDKNGFIWLGTQDGLTRYDGSTFKVFKRSNTKQSLGSDAIFSLAETDDLLLIGTLDGLYSYNFVSERFTEILLKTSKGESIKGTVRDIVKDKQGNIWLAISDKGVACLNKDGELSFFSMRNYQFSSKCQIRKLCVDKDNTVWIATHGNGLLCLTPTTGKIERYLVSDSKDISANNADAISCLNDHIILLGTEQRGMMVFDCNSRSFIHPGKEVPKIPQDAFIHSIYKDDNNRIWIGSEKGLFICSEDGISVNCKHSSDDPYSISDNAVYSICQDSEGGMWIGTFFGGVNYHSEFLSQFEKYYPIGGSNSISGKSISEFCQDSRGELWIGTEDAGLNLYDIEKESFSNGFLPAGNIHSLLDKGNSLLVGTYGNGLYEIDLQNHKVKHFTSSSQKESLNDDNIYSLFQDLGGNVWIGTLSGLYSYDNGAFRQICKGAITSQVNDIVQDSNGMLWIATIGQGLFLLDVNTLELTGFSKTLPVNIICLLRDNSHNLWIGTEGDGVYHYDCSNLLTIKHYSEDEGLPDNVIYKLLQDDSGYIWGSTNHGLFCLDSNSGLVNAYDHKAGLLCDQFNYKSGLKLNDGTLLFGGVKGFVRFDPEHLKKPVTVPRLVFNSFQLFNKEVMPSSGKSPLEKSILYTDDVCLRHSQSVFSIGFSFLFYPQARSTKFYYMLQGLDTGWIPTDKSAIVTYSNLRHGKYIFCVKATNAHHLWDDVIKKVTIRIRPPFYATTLAFVCYSLLVLTALWLSFYLSFKRIKKKNGLLIKELERQKETELYNSKIDFFTNITHEIRTPLTLITVPLEDVMAHTAKSDYDYENLSIMQRNAHRLLKLVNELLDFRNVERDGLKLNYVKKNVVDVLKSIVDDFSPSLAAKGVAIKEEYSSDTIEADIDEDIIIKIVSNLLNNAYKHADKLITVRAIAAGSIVKIAVSNDGDRIPVAERRRIFSPFVKLDPNSAGSGLGLPFAENLAKAHDGKLILDPSESETLFELTIPLTQTEKIVLSETDYKVEVAGAFDGQFDSVKKNITVLVVDDNPDFLLYLNGKLKSNYRVLVAENGEKAFATLEEGQIDLVISDVMMPVMDGMELCKRIKEDLRFSHIPVILLTAKTGVQSQIDGLKTGADEYISKPFSPEYLMARIDNLIDSRNKIRDAFQHSAVLSFKTIAYSKADEKFLEGFNSIINARMEEPDLDLDAMASEMNMSRATFFRKVKSVAEMTPNDYIRLCRLKKAAELIKAKEYRINEIAIIVGFSSSSYFTKCFYKQFGVLPKDFLED